MYSSAIAQAQGIEAVAQKSIEYLLTETAFERAAFIRGCNLARPPGPEELDAIEVARDFAPPGPGQIHLAISKDLATAIVAEVEASPEDLAAATWLGFFRGLAAHAGAAPVHVHDGGRA